MKTKAGFEYSIDTDAVNDVRFLRKMSKIDSDPFVVFDVLETMLGEEQVDNLITFYEKQSENGRVTINEFNEILTEMFSQVPQLKN